MTGRSTSTEGPNAALHRSYVVIHHHGTTSTKWEYQRKVLNINGASAILERISRSREPTDAVPQPPISDLLSQIPEKLSRTQAFRAIAFIPRQTHASSLTTALFNQKFQPHQYRPRRQHLRRRACSSPNRHGVLGMRNSTFRSPEKPSSPVRVTRSTGLNCSFATRSLLGVSFRDVVDPQGPVAKRLSDVPAISPLLARLCAHYST